MIAFDKDKKCYESVVLAVGKVFLSCVPCIQYSLCTYICSSCNIIEQVQIDIVKECHCGNGNLLTLTYFHGLNTDTTH